MDCVVFNDRLDALLDGTLLVNQQADTEAHRATCRRCDELYRLMHGDGSGPASRVQRARWAISTWSRQADWPSRFSRERAGLHAHRPKPAWAIWSTGGSTARTR